MWLQEVEQSSPRGVSWKLQLPRGTGGGGAVEGGGGPGVAAAGTRASPETPAGGEEAGSGESFPAHGDVAEKDRLLPRKDGVPSALRVEDGPGRPLPTGGRLGPRAGR